MNNAPRVTRTSVGVAAEAKLQELVQLFLAANHGREQREEALRLQIKKSEQAALALRTNSNEDLDQRFSETLLGLEKTKAMVDKSLGVFVELAGKLTSLKDPAKRLCLDENPVPVMAEQMRKSLGYLSKAEGFSGEACRHAEEALLIHAKAEKALGLYHRERSDAQRRLGEVRLLLSEARNYPHTRHIQKELRSLESTLRRLEGQARLDTILGYQEVSKGCELFTRRYEQCLALAERRGRLASGPTGFRLATAAFIGAIAAGLVRLSLMRVGYSSWLVTGWEKDGFVSWQDNWAWTSSFEWPGLEWTVYLPDTEPVAITIAFSLLVTMIGIYFAFRKKS